MAGGPRKFSEKIALLNQKEAEGNAAFDSIMVEVKSIRPNTSGSQLDILDCLTENDPNNVNNNINIDETIALNEHISVTYERQHHHGQNQFNHSHKHKKQDEQQRQNASSNGDAAQHSFQLQANHAILSNNTFLQLPNPSDSFRRAHSDSSIHHSATSNNNNNNFLQNQIENQINYNQQNHQQQATNQSPSHAQQVQFQHQFHVQSHHQFNGNQQQQIVHSNNFVQTNNFQPYYSTQDFNRNSSEFSEIVNKTFSATNNKCNTSNSNNLTNNSSIPNQMESNSSSLNLQTSSPTPVSPKNLQPQLLDPNQNISASNASNKTNSYLLPKFMPKNDSTSNVSPKNATNNLPRNLSPVYIPQQISTPNSQLSPQFNYQSNINSNSPQLLHNQYPSTLQQQQSSNVKNDLLSTNQAHFLNPNKGNTASGSLPDLTAFQFQNNQSHQNLQIQEYNQRIQHNQSNYDSQLLQPNFQQHNHIGAVKPTHNGSVSPTRGVSRYSPTHSNLNSIANRRPSPQRHAPLGLNTQPLIANSISSAQSTPTSPLHPSNQTLPSLEFTINSQQVTNYMNGSLSNCSVLLNNNSNPSIYRNGSNTTGINNGNNESLPPSPQSQQSCFNSPQGSPGPTSISPQDLNPFSSSNNYDLMQKKFDSINLESSQNNAAFNFYSVAYNNNTSISLTQAPNQINSLNINGQAKKNGIGVSCNNNNNNNNNTNNNKMTSVNKNNSDEIMNLTNTNGDSEIGANTSNSSIINSSRSGSLSSSGSGSNQLNNGNFFDDIDLQNLNSPYQSNQSNSNNHNSKNHKNSIPNIILTFSGDSIEKNDIIIKDLSSDLIYDDALMSKNEQFDLDLQILSESVTIDDQNTIDFNQQNLYHNS